MYNKKKWKCGVNCLMSKLYIMGVDIGILSIKVVFFN